MLLSVFLSSYVFHPYGNMLKSMLFVYEYKKKMPSNFFFFWWSVANASDSYIDKKKFNYKDS